MIAMIARPASEKLRSGKVEMASGTLLSPLSLNVTFIRAPSRVKLVKVAPLVPLAVGVRGLVIKGTSLRTVRKLVVPTNVVVTVLIEGPDGSAQLPSPVTVPLKVSVQRSGVPL